MDSAEEDANYLVCLHSSNCSLRWDSNHRFITVEDTMSKHIWSFRKKKDLFNNLVKKIIFLKVVSYIILKTLWTKQSIPGWDKPILSLQFQKTHEQVNFY
jgi:hypothetical protein